MGITPATRLLKKSGRPAVPVTAEILLGRIRVLENGCWEYLGSINPEGYGWFRSRGAHIYYFKFFSGPIPAGMQLDHTCHNPKECAGGVNCPHRRCVNPSHLEPVTKLENYRRGCKNITGLIGRGANFQRSKTHCPQGHEYAGDNLRIKKGERVCRECDRTNARDRARKTRGSYSPRKGFPETVIRDLCVSKVKAKPQRATALDRLQKKIKILPNGCWEFTGYVAPKGYGRLWDGKQSRMAHAMAYELFRGIIPDGLLLDHTCHKKDECFGGEMCPHRRCVNPWHLEPVTPLVNSQRGHQRKTKISREGQSDGL